MKKFIASVMAAAMAMGLSVPVFAAEYAPYTVKLGYSAEATFEEAYVETVTVALSTERDGTPEEQTIELVTIKPDSTLSMTYLRDDPFVNLKKLTGSVDTGYVMTGWSGIYDEEIMDLEGEDNAIVQLNDTVYLRLEGTNTGFDGAEAPAVPEAPAAPEAPAEPEVPATPAVPVSFSDVADGAYYAEAVKWAVENGVTSGTGNGKFSPNQTCTQGQILTFLYRAAGSPEVFYEAEDLEMLGIKETDFYCDATVWGFGRMVCGHMFDPKAPCTRADAVNFIYRALRPDGEVKESNFTDVSRDMDYAIAVDWAVTKGITSGTGDGKFSPEQTCTRGQIATFLYRAMGK